MAKPTGFLEYERIDPPRRPVEERIRDYRKVEEMMPVEALTLQAARCMDCGIPYCHSFGCPLGNLIPDWNEMVYRGQWRKALDLLQATCNFPEFTGRVCPAPCEAACTLMIDEKPVEIRHIELQIVERAWEEGWIVPQPPERRTGFKAAVIGSGPAGLVVAQELARAGHEVVVFERDDRVGGILRYGIPDFKLEKWVLERRLEQMRAEGVVFETGVDAGEDLSTAYLTRSFDAIVLTVGARKPRDLEAPGRDLAGVHFAMDFLMQQNKRVAGDEIPPEESITAKDKNVLVVGGGDTGSDCIGTSIRQGAKSVTQIELLPEPPEKRSHETNPWPLWPQILRTSSSQEEGCERLWSIHTKELVGKDGRVEKARCVRLNWTDPARFQFEEIPGSEFEIDAELILLAMGFVHAEHGALVRDFELKTDGRGNVLVDSSYMTSANGVFAAGDTIRGASLVVHAMAQGKQVARAVDEYLCTAK
ncbi:glutamate synthase subunit beta [Candidatus Sumerlaeota bacterium]|nr:glutamate synthase subunit beta [Candidatus Sumerlaeota bacterium]